MTEPSRSMRELFAAAREDAPAQVQREVMWGRVTEAVGLAAGAAALDASGGSASVAPQSAIVSSAAGASPAIGAKLVLAGGVIGACGTALGVVVTLLVVAPSSPPQAGPAARRPNVLAQRAVAPGARLAETAPRRRDPSIDERARAPRAENDAVTPRAPSDPASDLAEEARLLTEARAALVRGDGAKALSLVQATRRLATRSLEPEELGLEARALRALGRADEAAATELALKRRFPDSALAR
jgi:hypothetical protein